MYYKPNMSPVNDEKDSSSSDEINLDEIDDFLAASSDEDEQNGDAVVTAQADSTTDVVDGDLATLPHSPHPITASTKGGEISQEDIDAFLADMSDSESEDYAPVVDGMKDTSDKENVVKNDDFFDDKDVDNFLADAAEGDDDVPLMKVVNNLDRQGQDLGSEKSSDNEVKDDDSIDENDVDDFLGDGADNDDDVPLMEIVNNLDRQNSPNEKAATEKPETAAPASPVVAEESLIEKMAKMEKEMQEMRKQLAEQQKEKVPTESPGNKKRVSFGYEETLKIREAEIDLFASPSHTKTLPESQPAKQHPSKDPSPGSSKPKTSAGHRRRDAKGISKEDASKIVGPLSFYKKDEVKREDDSGSDWDDMDDAEKPYLSKQGKEIKKVLNGDRTRVAHTPKHESTSFKHRKDAYEGRPSASTSRQPSISKGADSSKTVKKEVDDPNVMKERYSGIRIVNPLIPNAVMKIRMEKKKMMKLSELSLTSKNYLNDSDWVTIGVVINMSETRTSSNGKKYVIWKLSDLKDCDKTVSLFLFGETYKKLWKENSGIVIGVLNPSFMAPAEKQNSIKSEVCMTVDHPQKIMMMGKAKDLGRCQSRTKAGNACTNVINKQTGEFCSYHVQAAYKKTSAKRSELQAGFNAPIPRSFEQKLVDKGQVVFYGGQSYSSENFKRQKKKDKVTLNSVKNHGKANTMSLSKLQPEDEQKLKDLVSSKKEAFQDMLQQQSVGSVNFMRHLQNAEKIEQEKKQKKQPMTSVTFKNFIKEANQHNERVSGRLPEAAGSSRGLGAAVPDGPQLGRGFGPGSDILLESPTRKSRRSTDENREKSSLPGLPSNLKSMSKEQAAAKLKKNINKQDPNRVKKKVTPEAQRRIKKRLLEKSEEKDGPSDLTPPQKKPRILGGLDIDSAEVQKLLKEGSSHKGAVSDVINEGQEKYFQGLECKEKMEEKMLQTTRVICKVVSCKKCKYTAQKPADRCKELGHHLVYSKAYKQFFKCCDCGSRCVAFDKYPNKSCKKCGGSKYERTSMLAERKGAQLESEKLLLRGEELKFLNSMN